MVYTYFLNKKVYKRYPETTFYFNMGTNMDQHTKNDQDLLTNLVASGVSLRPSLAHTPRRLRRAFLHPPLPDEERGLESLLESGVPIGKPDGELASSMGEAMEVDEARAHAHGLLLSGVPMYAARRDLEELPLSEVLRKADQILALMPPRDPRVLELNKIKFTDTPRYMKEMKKLETYRKRKSRPKSVRLSEAENNALEMILSFYGLGFSAFLKLLIKILALQMPRPDALAMCEESMNWKKAKLKLKGVHGANGEESIGCRRWSQTPAQQIGHADPEAEGTVMSESVKLREDTRLKEVPHLWYGTTETLLALCQGEAAVRHYRFLNYDPVGQEVNMRLNSCFSDYIETTDLGRRFLAMKRAAEAADTIKPMIMENPVTFIRERMALDRKEEANRNRIYLDLPERSSYTGWFTPKMEWFANSHDLRRTMDSSLTVSYLSGLPFDSDLTPDEMEEWEKEQARMKERTTNFDGGDEAPELPFTQPVSQSTSSLPRRISAASEQHATSEPVTPIPLEYDGSEPMRPTKPFMSGPLSEKNSYDPIIEHPPSPEEYGHKQSVSSSPMPQVSHFRQVEGQISRDVPELREDERKQHPVPEVTKLYTINIADRDNGEEDRGGLMAKYRGASTEDKGNLEMYLDRTAKTPSILRFNAETDPHYVFSPYIGDFSDMRRFIYSPFSAPVGKEPLLCHLRRWDQGYVDECSARRERGELDFSMSSATQNVLVLREMPYPLARVDEVRDIVKVYAQGYTPVYNSYALNHKMIENMILPLYKANDCLMGPDINLVQSVIATQHMKHIMEKFDLNRMKACKGTPELSFVQTDDREQWVKYLESQTHGDYGAFLERCWACEDRERLEHLKGVDADGLYGYLVDAVRDQHPAAMAVVIEKEAKRFLQINPSWKATWGSMDPEETLEELDFI